MNHNLQRARRFLSRPGRRDKLRHKLRLFQARNRPAVRRNRARLEQEIEVRAPRLDSHPATLILDPASACNLSCPFCPTGGKYGPIEKELLTPDRFAEVVKHIETELLEKVFLYREGEPFINRNILEYIQFFSTRGAYVEISTNFSMQEFDSCFLNGLVDSGLSELKVSVDGASQETYETYRVGGDLSRVVRNMKGLAEIKKSRRRSYPHVTYRMLLTRKNQHEVGEAAVLAAECGADFHLDTGFWCPEGDRDDWMPDSSQADPDNRFVPAPEGAHAVPLNSAGPIETYCRQLWDTVVVNANGDVYPCCLMFKPEDAVGNLIERDFEEIRNDPRMQYLRRYVTDATVVPPDFESSCPTCQDRHCVAATPAFAKQPWR